MKKWLKKGIHIPGYRKFVVLILLSAIAMFLYGCSNKDDRLIQVWLYGGPNWGYYFEINNSGKLFVYKTEIYETPSHPTKTEEGIRYICDNAIESAMIELSQEQFKEIKSLADLLKKRVPEPNGFYINDYFGECEVQYKGKRYYFYYFEKDKIITKIIELSPIPVVDRMGYPMHTYEWNHRE